MHGKETNSPRIDNCSTQCPFITKTSVILLRDLLRIEANFVVRVTCGIFTAITMLVITLLLSMSVLVYMKYILTKNAWYNFNVVYYI